MTMHFSTSLHIYPDISLIWVFLVAQTVKNLPSIQETGIQSLGWEDPPGEGNFYPLRILAWIILWTEELGELWSMGSQKSFP